MQAATSGTSAEKIQSDVRTIDPFERTGSIRIRLSYDAENATVDGPDGRRILRKQGGMCALFDDENMVDSGVVRLDAGDGVLTLASWRRTANRFRGVLECRVLDDVLALINELPLEDYMAGLAEEPDSEPYEKQKAFAIAARSYAAHYREEENRKFPGMPYDGSDTGASFQEYGGFVFERRNPQWVRAVRETEGLVLQKGNRIIKAAYFSSDDGRTRSPEENGWRDFPFADVFAGKPDPWCRGMPLRGHGVGMSGCGAGGQAREGKSAEEILKYYYPGTAIGDRDG